MIRADFAEPAIDPGERWLAVTGVRPLLTEADEGVSAAQRNAAMDLEFRINKLAARVARDDADRADPSEPIDYMALLDRFGTEGGAEEARGQAERTSRDIPIGEVGHYLAAAARAYNYLRGHYPISVQHSVLGPVSLEPSQLAICYFEDLLEVLDQPLRALDMIGEGRFTSLQAAALKAVYPTLYDTLAGALLHYCTRERGKDPDYVPHFERGLSVLLGVPGLDPKISSTLPAPGPKPTGNAKPAQSNPVGHIAPKSDRLEMADAP